MALGASNQIANILKTWYKDGVENLLLRDSPVLKQLTTLRVEGKEQAFAAVYGSGGAVSAKFLQAKALATETVRNAEFKVTPGKVFSPYSMNADEVQASLSKKGAYMKAAGNKLFASTSALRRTMAAAFYGNSYGVIGKMPGSGTVTSEASGTTVTFTDTSIPAALDVGSLVQLKTNYKAADSDTTKAEVIAIDDDKITFKGSAAISYTASTYIQIHGSVDSAGNGLLPMGLDGWLPVDRTGLSTSFFNVNRSVAPARLAGSIQDDSAQTASTYGKAKTVKALLKKVRRHGSKADLIVMNDNDFLEFANEIEATNTYFTQTSTKEAKKASVGFKEITASFSTNFIENIVDDPHCPKGRFYILDKEAVEIWSYTNAGFIDNGIAGNNPGKENVENFDNEGHANDPHKLIIDDYINVQPGSGSDEGPDVLVTLFFTGAFVCTNPSVCGVGVFAAAAA